MELFRAYPLKPFPIYQKVFVGLGRPFYNLLLVCADAHKATHHLFLIKPYPHKAFYICQKARAGMHGPNYNLVLVCVDMHRAFHNCK